MATNRFSAPTLEIVTFIYVFDYLQIFAHQREISFEFEFFQCLFFGFYGRVIERKREEGETLSEVV